MSSAFFTKLLLTGRRGEGTIHYMKIRLVIVNIEDCAGLLSAPERFCSGQRLARAEAIADAGKRMQSYAAELALSFALSGDALLPPVYSYDEKGRPVIEGGFVSLSHSGNYAVCAYSPAPVGVDIEERRPVESGLARRILCPAERKEYERSGVGYLLGRFVMKEAFFKLTGEGISGGFHDVFESEGRLFRRGVLAGFPVFFGTPGYACCVVSSAFPEEIELISDPHLRIEKQLTPDDPRRSI